MRSSGERLERYSEAHAKSMSGLERLLAGVRDVSGRRPGSRQVDYVVGRGRFPGSMTSCTRPSARRSRGSGEQATAMTPEHAFRLRTERRHIKPAGSATAASWTALGFVVVEREE